MRAAPTSEPSNDDSGDRVVMPIAELRNAPVLSPDFNIFINRADTRAAWSDEAPQSSTAIYRSLRTPAKSPARSCARIFPTDDASNPSRPAAGSTDMTMTEAWRPVAMALVAS